MFYPVCTIIGFQLSVDFEGNKPIKYRLAAGREGSLPSNLVLRCPRFTSMRRTMDQKQLL